MSLPSPTRSYYGQVLYFHMPIIYLIDPLHTSKLMPIIYYTFIACAFHMPIIYLFWCNSIMKSLKPLPNQKLVETSEKA